jgi:AraC-like DNA-binding protein
MNSFSELFSSYTPLEQFFIFNRHGETVFGESGFNIETSFFSGESGYFKIKYKGAPGIAFYAKSDVNGWIYVNVAKNVHIYAEANAYLVSMSLLTLLALALAGVVVVIIHRLGRRPVNILEEEIRENFIIVKRKTVDALLNGEAADFTGGAFFSPSLSLYGENFIVLQIQAKAFSPETLSHVDAIVAEHTYGISALTSPGLLVCVLSFSADDMAAAYELARIVADYIRTILVYEYELDVAVGVGGYVKARADIPKSYNQAGNALKYSESAEKNPITAFEDIKNQINETPEIAAKPKPEPEIMKTIKKYVTRCFSDPTVTLGFVAENFNISVSYLSRLFKAHTDKTFLEYIIALRMEKAKQLLWETDMPVEEIVGEVGYRNYASFAKTFKKYAGISANEYRKERV